MNTSSMACPEQTTLKLFAIALPLLFGRLTREEAQRQMNGFTAVVDKEGMGVTENTTWEHFVANLEI